MLYEQFAGKFFHDTSLSVVLDKSIMLLGRAFGQRVKPVRVVRSTHFDGPFFHAGCHFVGNAAVQWSTVVDDVGQLCEDFTGQVTEHLIPIENILGEILRRAFRRWSYFDGTFLERRLDHSES